MSIDGHSPAGTTTVDPSTGAQLEFYAFQTAEEIDAILTVARQGFAQWSGFSLDERSRIFHRISQGLTSERVKLATLITREMGKIRREAEAEIDKCARLFEYYAKEGARLLASERLPVDEARVTLDQRPLGPILAIMPWNFPFWQVARFSAGAWIAGNTIVLKHSPNVFGCAREFSRVLLEAGMPPGGLSNLFVPPEALAKVVSDQRIVGVTLTGSGRAGADVAAKAGAALKKVVLELGGSDPLVVLADADVEAAVQGAIKSRFANAGQVCIAAKRFIVVEPIYDSFRERLLGQVERMRAGDPTSEKSDIGPIARSDLRDVLHDQVARSIAAGAHLLTGGRFGKSEGYFYEPTVLDAVEPGMAAFEEETFGPVAALTRARDCAEAIELANRSRYGLCGSIWTRNVSEARNLAARLQVGSVFVNAVPATDPRTPVGGLKDSGFGRELAGLGPREFANAQTVWS